MKKLSNILKISLIGISFILIVNPSCSSLEKSKLSFHLKNLRMINSAVDTAHWEIITKWEGSDYLRYALQKNTEEFSKTLTFDFNKKDKKYTIEDFFVIFKKDLLQYTVYMTKDTVYYLKEPLDELRPIFELGKKSFIKGKYNYQMRYGTLDPGQRRYYLVHMDSLKSITGDELPKLPVIEESDSIWFKYSNEEK